MASTSNPATDPETYPTTAEVGLFVPLLLSDHTPGRKPSGKWQNQGVHTALGKMGRGGDKSPFTPSI